MVRCPQPLSSFPAGRSQQSLDGLVADLLLQPVKRVTPGRDGRARCSRCWGSPIAATALGPTEALTRFGQASRIRLLQRDFKSDFEGKAATAAAANAPAAPGTVRVQTYAPQGGTATWVNAPYGIYSPGEIPKEYHSQIMESGKAYQWRNEGRINNVGFERELQRLENRGELTVGDMVKLSRRGGADMNTRIAMAKVGNDFRFVGYDMSQGGPGGSVHSGFVESEKGTTSGVGRALFADRITRALLNQASGMNLEVYTSKRTADFHVQIFAVAGRQGAPTEGQKYRLTTGKWRSWPSHGTPS